MRKCVFHAATAMSQSDQKPEIKKSTNTELTVFPASAAAIYSFLFPDLKKIQGNTVLK